MHRSLAERLVTMPRRSLLQKLRRATRPAAILFGYAILFVLFETQATFFEVGPGVSLYYPSAGLNLALVLVFGLRYAPAIFVAGMASSVWINTPPIPLYHFLIPGLAITTGIGIAAWWLRRVLQRRTLFSPGTALRLAGVMAGLAAWNSLSAVSGYLLTGLEGYTIDTAGARIFLWWVADWAGMLIVTPPLLFAARMAFEPSTLGAWAEDLPIRWPASPRAVLETVGELGAIALSLYGAFFLHDSHLLYLCFLPLLWIALRHGMPRSTLGVLLITSGAAGALRALDAPGSMLVLQLFVIVLALTGLFLGALVSERKRAFRTLKQGLAANSATGSSSPSTPLFDEDGQLLANSLRAEQQRLADEAGTLQDQNRRKDQLFSLIAHDLKNLVGTSASMTDVLKEESETLSQDTLNRFIHHLNRSTWQAHDLLVDLLEWGQVYVERAASKQETVHVTTFVTAALQHAEERAAEKEITLEQHIDPTLTVHGHAGLLQAVVRNLLSNAIKFTEAGGCVRVCATANADGVTVSVHDNGVGIDTTQQERLFEPAVGASRSGTAGEQGSGLGLVLCHDIIKQHGGTIWAESPTGNGSSFFFTLPASPTAR